MPHPIWVTPPGGLPEVTGWENPDGTVDVGEPEPIPDDEVINVEGEAGGGGGDGGFGGGYGGGFGFGFGGFGGFGGSGGGGGSAKVDVGDVETIAIFAQ